MAKFEKFIESLSIVPKDISIYRKALTHLSAAADPSQSYERLEFLGDSIIGLIISGFLYKKFVDKEEGDLSRIRALIVSRESLGAKALEIGIDKHLRVDTVRVREGEQAEFSILADAFEALVGAIFADRGYTAAKTFVLRHFRDDCIQLKDTSGPSDYKSQLQELWQRKHKDTPDYTVVSEIGPDHKKEFTIRVKFGRKVLGTGVGSSKKRAEQEAARDALENQARDQKKIHSKRKRRK